MNAPADYIDVSKIKPPPKRTLRNDIEVVISKFGRQQFCAKHVFWVLLEDEHYKEKDPDSLYGSIRPEVHALSKQGVLEVVSRGKPGTSNVYRALQSKAS